MVAVIRAVVVNKAAHLWHGNAQRGGGIITERKGVQRTGIIKTDGQPRQHHHQHQLEFRPAYAAKAAQQPEHHVARLLRAGRGADGIGGNGVKQLRGRYARQIVRSLPPRAPLVRKATKAKAAKAPANAPAESDTAPVPIPNTTTDTAPVDAPADTPST